jgi:hypothetical protein
VEIKPLIIYNQYSPIKNNLKPGMMVHACNSREIEEGELKSEVSPGKSARPYLKQRKKVKAK